jgi:hypothetical protein
VEILTWKDNFSLHRKVSVCLFVCLLEIHVALVKNGIRVAAKHDGKREKRHKKKMYEIEYI